MPAFEIASQLAAPRQHVWAHASTMAGVNAELRPLIRMTYPRATDRLDPASVPLGRPLFRSWVLLLGILPIDRHDLTLVSIDPPTGFYEDSRSWLQRRWVHIRTLEETPHGCRVTDRLDFTPRLPAMGRLLSIAIRRIFEHRHGYLRRRFG
ncbi:MAG TPA: hypothetical protein VMW17_01485 [Candidatus Binatia bacterium]|nr:hypothetical protein [Candidatus Binatia bacterium]